MQLLKAKRRESHIDSDIGARSAILLLDAFFLSSARLWRSRFCSMERCCACTGLPSSVLRQSPHLESCMSQYQTASSTEADYYVILFFVIENGRKCDFRSAKKITTSSFDVPPYRDFVILIFFHGGISRKIRAELHVTRRSAPRRVERSNGMRHLLGNCVWLVTGPARSSRSRKELSLSRSMSCLRRS